MLLIIDGIEKPGNLGAIARTAAAAGVSAIFLTDPGSDPWNPNAIRASRGLIFRTPVFTLEATHCQQWLCARGLRVVLADPAATDHHWDTPLLGPVALVFGAEHAGIGAAWRQPQYPSMHVPMPGGIDSLNLSASVAVVVYEALRQRRQ